MRYDSFYPFQQLSAIPRQPLPPAQFLQARGANPLFSLGQMAQQLPKQLPTSSAPLSKLDSFLQTADKLFVTAQNYTPYIQQAVPMVKNLPSLYRMYKGFQNLPDIQSPKSNAQPTRKNPSQSHRNRRETSLEPSDLTTKPSKPRIFQPPLD